jgi:hypothetical protein
MHIVKIKRECLVEPSNRDVAGTWTKISWKWRLNTPRTLCDSHPFCAPASPSTATSSTTSHFTWLNGYPNSYQEENNNREVPLLTSFSFSSSSFCPLILLSFSLSLFHSLLLSLSLTLSLSLSLCLSLSISHTHTHTHTQHTHTHTQTHNTHTHTHTHTHTCCC